MEKYVVFQCYSNKELFTAVKNRCIELGYKSRGENFETVSLDITSGYMLYTSNYDEKNPQNDHETGDLNKLFYSEYYKFKQPIIIGMYDVIFLSDGIKVGCQKVDKETIKKIADHFFDVS
jgi:hypothetical protein